MKKFLASLLLALILPSAAFAQSTCSYITTGAVLTAGQWNFCFSSKQDALGYTPVNRGGDTMTGPLTTFAPSASASGFNLTPGTAPSAPKDGDLWTTNLGLFARINGATVGPFVSSTNAPVTSVFGRTGAVTAATNDYSFAQISGTATGAQLPTPTLSSLGGVKSFTAVTHEFLTGIDTTGTPTKSQPSASDLSDGTTGTGSVVLSASPTITAPAISGTATGTYTLGGTPTLGGSPTLGASLASSSTSNNIGASGAGIGGVFFGTGTTPLSAYDEGSWTPTIEGTTTPGTQTYAVQVGRYIRIGNIVMFFANIQLTAKDGATSGNIQIGGLPFASSNISNLRSAVAFSAWSSVTLTASYTALVGQINENTTKILLLQNGSGQPAITIPVSAFSSVSAFNLSGTYRIN